MSDDSNARYRTSDPYGHAPAAAGPGSDPLAELARLIGQNDPFSEFGRDSRAPAPHDARYAEPAPPHEVAYGHAPQNDWHNPPPAAPAYEPYPQHAPMAAEPQHYADQSYSDPQHAQPATYHPEQGGYAQPVQGNYAQPHPGYEAPAYAEAAPEQQDFQQPPFQQPAYPQDDSQQPQGDEYYDDAPPESRRKGLITVVAVLGLAVVGTAGAFGYRSVFGSSHANSAPPVIRASSEPSKVAPPPQTVADASAAKLSYDRFGDRSQNEQVKVREEQPLDIKELAARSAQPAPVTTNVASINNSAGAGASASVANPPSVLTEPRRVRTVQIHPDQQESVSPRQPLPQPTNAAPPRQASVAAAAPANAPIPLAPETVAPRSAPHVVRTAPRAQQAADAPSGNAPLSLSPDSAGAPAAPQLASTRSNPRVASIAPTGSGHYLVQVSSQRSEADAQSSFRSLKSKYSGVLGDRQPVIRKADLGSKGTYYRAMVGPFASRADAIQLCGSLKAAGGDCVVQGN